MADFGQIPPTSVSGIRSFGDDPDKQKAIDDFNSLATLISEYEDGKISLDQLHEQGQKFIDDLKRLSSKLPQDVQKQIGTLDNIWDRWDQVSPGRLASALFLCGYCIGRLTP